MLGIQMQVCRLAGGQLSYECRAEKRETHCLLGTPLCRTIAAGYSAAHL